MVWDALSEVPMERREALGTLLAGAASAALAPSLNAAGRAMPEAPAAKAGVRAIQPLPFDPKKLDGLSEKLILSHHDNNYAGAVKNLNKVEHELAQATADTPPFVVGGLKQSQLTFANSKLLHEHYFANLGGSGRPEGPVATALARAWGSLDRWEQEFRAVGTSLGGGSGWVVLALDAQTGDLRNAWSGNHTQAPVLGFPLLVMDMYEHAYQMDYGAAAAKYVDAFFANANWDEVNRRWDRALKAAKAMRGAV